MAEKLRAIVFGGYDRHVPKIRKRLQPFLDFEHVTTEENPSGNKGSKAQVVIVLSDFASTENFKKAEVIALRNKLPWFECKSENYVLEELQKRGFLKNGASDSKSKEPASKPVEVPPPALESKVGLSADKIWEMYGEKAIAFANDDTIMEPGTRLDEVDLLDLLSSYIGIPSDDCKLLLYHSDFLSNAYFINTVGTTWKKRPKEADYDEEDTIEAPKSKKASAKDTFLTKLPGLHPGPYVSIWAISKELKKYKDFFRQDEKPSSDSYRLRMAQQGLEEGVVEEKDGAFYVKSNPKVVLVPVDPPPAPPKEVKKEPPKKIPVVDPFPVLGKEDKKFPELEKLAAGYVSLADFKKDAPKAQEPIKEPVVRRMKDLDVDLSDPESVRELIVIDKPVLLSGQLALIRSLMPNRYWEIAATQSLQEKLKAVKSPLKTLSRNLFGDDDWDALAWDTLSKAKFGDIAQILREVYEDRKCSCSDCGAEFTFSRGEQEYQFRTFKGELITPRRCVPCRKIRKEGGGSYDPQDKILRRHGGV